MKEEKQEKDAIEAIFEILNPNCIPVNCNSQSEVYIEENDVTARLKKIILSDLTSGMLVFCPDQGTKIKHENKHIMTCMSPLLIQDGTTPHNRACDAVIICQENKENSRGCKIIYIEMKSGSKSAKEQFQSTYCFIIYLEKLLSTFYGIETNIINHRYILIRKQGSINKKPTRCSESEKAGSNPDNPKILYVQNKDKISIKRLKNSPKI